MMCLEGKFFNLRYCFVWLSAVCAFSCAKEAGDNTDVVSADVTLRVEVKALAGDDPGFENSAGMVRVFAFNSDGGLDSQMKFTSSGFTNTMKLRLGEKVFCAVANEPEYASLMMDDVASINELSELYWTELPDFEDTESVMPFTVVKEQTVTGASVVDLELVRAVGKVEMRVYKAPEVILPVYMDMVQVVRTPNKSRMMEGDPLDPAAEEVLLVDLPPQTWDRGIEIGSENYTSGHVQMTPKYMFEYIAGQGDEARAAATALKIVLRIGDADAVSYEVPVVSAFDGDGSAIYCILRNKRAEMDIRVADNGKLKVTYTALSWEEGGQYDKNMGEDDSNISIEEWIDAVPYDHEI